MPDLKETDRKMRLIVYRNLAVFGAIALLLNSIFFSQIEKLSYASQVIDLTAVPLTIIATVLWLNKRILIFALVVFLIGFTIELTAQYSTLLHQFDTRSLSKFYTGFTIAGLLITLVTLFIKTEKGWLMKSLEKTELYTLLTVIIIPTITLTMIFVLFSN